MKMIRGSGGGGKGGGGASARVAIESPDSLRSKQFARVLDLVSEGEIVGLVDGLKSVFLNDTPVQNTDGSFNFTGITLDTRTGTQSQTYIPGFQSVEAETAVSVAVKAATPVVRTITNANVDAVRVTVSVPQLSFQNTTNGDIGGTSVNITIDVQTAGGGFVPTINDTISGKTTSRYQRAYRIELAGAGPWDIRVSRVTADSTSVALQNATFWDSFTEIIDAKLIYPNSALAALSVDAEKFSSIPRRGYELKGVLVRIPSNYNPVTRVYTGVWDGTFTISWTDNPAWCFFDLLTTPRYGLGDFIDIAQVDKWALFTIGQYCDELVSDGLGGLEPRFTCNLYLQTREEAYNVIVSFASIFAGLAYWSSGSVTATQDSPSDPVALFTPANVINTGAGAFSYTGSSLKSRHTVALVTWNDPADRYKQKVEYVEDTEGIAKYGIVQTEVIAIGSSSRGQAHRLGRRILFAERMETEVINFRAGLDGLSVAPGEVIQTSDPVRAGVRVGGRFISATSAAVVLDAPVTIDAGKAYTLWAVLPDGTVQSRAVTTGASTTDTLAVSPDFTAAPLALAVWVLAASDLVPETWRVISVEEVENTQASITALAFRADKFGAIEQDLILEPLRTSILDVAQATPTDFSASESLYLVSNTVVGTRVTASWSGNAPRYELQYRRVGNNWVMISISSPSVDIQPADPGVYEFILTAINSIGRRSQSVAVSQEVFGKTTAPVSISGFSIIKNSGIGIAQWSLHPDLDVQINGTIIIRHSQLTSGASWNDGIIVEEFPGGLVSGIVPLITGTYMAKARDSSGNYSAGAVSFVATEGMVTGFTTVGTSTQHPAFTGAKTNVALDTTLVGIKLDSTTLVDSMVTNIDDWPFIDAIGGVSATGSYAFDTYLDLATVATRRFESDIKTLSYGTGDLFDYRLTLIDAWDDFDGDVIYDCDVTLYASTTDDDPAGAPTWSAWTQFFVADFTGRAAKFKLDFISGSPTHNILVTELRVVTKIPA